MLDCPEIARVGPVGDLAMPILNRPISLYETRGIGISTGLSAWRHANLPLVTFTWFMRGGESITDGLGIALQEIYFLECLFDRYRPKSIFVIGNSWGWSTLGLSLINPQARVVAIDAGLGQNSLEGLDFTNRVAHEEKLNLIAVKASSPHDVSGVLAREFAAPVDFAFIDGYHTEQQVALDFAAIQPSAAADAVYLFHDVLQFALAPGVARAAASVDLPWFTLEGTTSGMAVLFDPARNPDVAQAIAPFRASDAAKAIMDREVYKVTHRRWLKWRRSFDKRVKRVKSLLGAS
jgi:predicted O-methyltransferase YrrM